MTSGYPYSAVPARRVELPGGFWRDRIVRNREVTVGHVLDACDKTGRIRNFERAMLEHPGPFCSDYPYDDSDVYKCVEGAARALSTGANRAGDLEARLDRLIETIAAAQESDGYLYTFARFEFEEDERGRSRAWWYGPGRWEKVHLHSHELYTVGHLYEAAAAHFAATGKRTLLDVALKNADLIVRTFGEGDGRIRSVPGHQEVELGLMRLFEITGNADYLDLARFFLNGRGRPDFGIEGGEYWQNHRRVQEQREAVGHAVRAAYMYSAMADADALTGSGEYTAALRSLWSDVVRKKLYLTGGIGSTGANEGFQDAFVLPNDSAYCETCAAIANVLWNQRMFLLFGESRYVDVLERALYNNVLSGVSLDGRRFFYPNPLESDGRHQRTEWFTCACCPSNLVRFLPQVPGFVYAVREKSVFINLFLTSTARILVGDVEVRIEQHTDYPWDGAVRIRIDPESPCPFTLKVRTPSWTGHAPLPGGLYAYLDGRSLDSSLWLDGSEVEADPQDGYLSLTRTWSAGDTVTVEWPMHVRFVEADARVEADAGRVAIERGPLVYAAEEIDNGVDVRRLSIDPAGEWKVVPRPDLLGGVSTVHGEASFGGRRRPFTAVPYYAWANRGKGTMAVWLERN